MIKTNLFQSTDVHSITQQVGCYSVLEYDRDISVTAASAETAYFSSQMNVRKKQVICRLDGGNSVVIQAGAMQVMLGDGKAATNIKGAGDLMKKFVGSKVTGETTIKPKYTGNGIIVLEPTYKHIIIEDVSKWGGGMVIEDGMFLACDSSLDMRVTARSTLSSAVLGNEGLFNTALRGTGYAVLESLVPADELMIVDLENDTVKIDGNMAIAWSESLKFTVERTTASLVGSAASGEGLVNVYRGTGRILIAPVAKV